MVYTWQEIDENIQLWMRQARENIIHSFKEELTVNTKSNRNDLVTNMDRSTEDFYVSCIKQTYPEAKILGEESHKDVEQTKGLFFVIDPIDGTMNFVKQKDNFASMIAVYQDGKALLGYIYDVMGDKLYWGGEKVGVFCNHTRLNKPKNLELKDGLLGVGMPFLMSKELKGHEVAQATSGVRIIGSAGMEYINVITGKYLGYVSKLKPWDYAAGKILAETLGLVVKTIDDKPLDVLSSNVVLVATEKSQKQIAKIING